MSIIFCLTAFALWLIMMNLKSKKYLHIVQLEGYDTDKFNSWILANKKKIYNKHDICFFIASLVIVFLYFIFSNIRAVKIIFFIAITILYLYEIYELVFKKTVSKKPFVCTKRAKRLWAIASGLVVTELILYILLITLFTGNFIKYFPICIGLMSLSYFLCVYYVFFSNVISVPIENRINKKFYDMASEKIRSLSNLKTVGITGSYGKTSTKFITAAILSHEFKVMNTPDSYNTPMGISKIINNDLDNNYDIFIAELGATKKGDISEVAYLSNPEIGVLTSIAPCHLQSFGSIENIAQGKYELIEYLPEDGTAIFNYDNLYVKELADKTKKKKILYALENIGDADVYAKDITVNERGSSFTLCIRDKGKIKCETSLLGKHNILNILAGVCVADVLNMSLEQIRSGIKNISSVKHRLELIDPKTGVLVIDDAFNSNPDGAFAALEVLNSFKNNRKIIITPGMIELGEIEKIENKKFGEKISQICDIVILIGKKRTKPIYEGLTEKNFDINSIYTVNSIADSSEILKSITKCGDIILYENDLPDTYD